MRELLSLLVAAHGNDRLSTHLLGRQNAEQAYRAIAGNQGNRSPLHIRRVGGEPAGPKHVRCCQQARQQVVRRDNIEFATGRCLMTRYLDLKLERSQPHPLLALVRAIPDLIPGPVGIFVSIALNRSRANLVSRSLMET